MGFRLCAAAILSLAAVFGSAAAPRQADAERARVRDFVAHFIASFERLDIDAFMDCFDAEATVFFPSPEPGERYAGKAAIREHFQKVFSGIRNASRAAAPPYHRLAIEDLDVQLLDAHAAVVTFHLRNAERLARRTLVLAQTQGRWQIVHLHASNMPITPAAASPASAH
jgi:uncharacterized protein (TIGR02246 family)